MKSKLPVILIVGAVIGALNLFHYQITKMMVGAGTPFGLFPGGLPVAITLAITGKNVTYELLTMAVLGIGIVMGSFLDAALSRDLSLTTLRAKKLPMRKAGRAWLGGMLMGAGIWMSAGCLIRHVLSGIPGLMLVSFLTLAGIVAGIWLSAVIETKWIR